MTAVSLLCDLCDNAITGDSHWPHDTDCIERDGCTCAVVCCLGCCPECAPSPAGGKHGPATVEAPPVGTRPAPPAGRNPKAINNGACDNGDGLSSPSPSSAPAERRKRETSETGSPRMGSTTAVTQTNDDKETIR